MVHKANWVLGASLLLFLSTTVSAGEYSSWKYDKKNDRYHCSYKYEKKDGDTGHQTILYYSQKQDPKRTGYYYYHNLEGKCWARCVCPGHPKYNKNVMEWHRYKNKSWQPYPEEGFCPPPADGVAPIDDIPAPPI